VICHLLLFIWFWIYIISRPGQKNMIFNYVWYIKSSNWQRVDSPFIMMYGESLNANTANKRRTTTQVRDNDTEGRYWTHNSAKSKGITTFFAQFIAKDVLSCSLVESDCFPDMMLLLQYISQCILLPIVPDLYFKVKNEGKRELLDAFFLVLSSTKTTDSLVSYQTYEYEDS